MSGKTSRVSQLKPSPLIARRHFDSTLCMSISSRSVIVAQGIVCGALLALHCDALTESTDTGFFLWLSSRQSRAFS